MVGYQVRLQGSYIAWRGILRKRWIRLDRVAEVTDPRWMRNTFSIKTDDGHRLRVLVSGGYLKSARRFVDHVDRQRAALPERA